MTQLYEGAVTMNNTNVITLRVRARSAQDARQMMEATPGFWKWYSGVVQIG
jgi:hypothetical protein